MDVFNFSQSYSNKNRNERYLVFDALKDTVFDSLYNEHLKIPTFAGHRKGASFQIYTIKNVLKTITRKNITESEYRFPEQNAGKCAANH